MSLWHALAATPVAMFVKTSAWAYPILETVHVVGLGLLFGAIVAMDLRLLGMNVSLPASVMARHLLPWVWVGFAMNVSSGALLFLSDAPAFAANTSFRIKLALLALAGLNALLFHRSAFKSVADWEQNRAPPAAAKVAAIVSIALWIAVIAAGRMIAYAG